MSLISDIAGAIAGTTPKTSGGTSPAEISRRIGEAKSRLADLRRQYGLACLDALDGDAAQRDRLSGQIESEARDVTRLELALVASRQRALEETGRQASALRDSRIHSATIHMRAAEKAAKKLTDALADAAKARRDLLAASTKVVASSPDPLPVGSLTGMTPIDRAISHEMHRLSWEPTTVKRKGTGGLPGAISPDFKSKNDPASIVPLLEQLRQAHDRAIEYLRGGIAVPGSVVIEDLAQPAQAVEAVIAEPGEFNPAELLPGTRSAQEIQPSIPRTKLSVGDSE